MPYRRLPKTDQARLRALQRAVQQAGNAAYNDQAVNYRTITEAQRFLMQFENQVAQYHANFDSKVTANKQYRHRVRNARMYISHFIQVLNLAVIRGEIKRSQKELYKLDPKSDSLPDLSSEEGLMEWGQNIIDGETERTMSSPGSAIYNPSIGKVRVHYELFAEAYQGKKVSQKTSSRFLDNIQNLRVKADQIILDLWNQIEGNFAELGTEAMQEKSKEFGIVYYLRRKEKQKLGLPVSGMDDDE